MDLASFCCFSIHELGLILITLDAAVVHFLVEMNRMLIGWPKDVYLLLGFTTNTSHIFVLRENHPTKALPALFSCSTTHSLSEIYVEQFLPRSYAHICASLKVPRLLLPPV